MRGDLFQPGDRVGEYQIVRRLRAGGMATLFLGRRNDVAGVFRPVAIKVIHPHLVEDQQIVRMFIDEARISSHISHQNVVYVEKFGEHEGVYFIAMEYVDGCSISQTLRALWERGEQLDPEVAVKIAIETASGLHAAHETVGEDGQLLGIVHRDVSPSNVLITRDGNIKVIDFGIAKARNRLGETRDGSSLKGKVRYMSPEQAWGRSLDRTTDVYALGIVLWEMLTCKQLFKGSDDLEILERVRDPQIPPPSTLNPKVSPALDEIVLRAVARDPADRIRTALELRKLLVQTVPGATSVTAETLSELVATVRSMLPEEPAITDDDKPTTPAEPLQTHDLVEVPASAVGSSVGAVQPARRARRWVSAVVATGMIALGAGTGLVVAKRSTTERPAATQPVAQPASPSAAAITMPVTTVPVTTVPVTTVPVTTAPPTTVPVTTPPPVDAEVAVEPPAPLPLPVVVHAPTPVRRPVRGKPAVVKKSTVRSVTVDGTVLADDTADTVDTKPRPRPKTRPVKPRDEVRVDDTVLAR